MQQLLGRASRKTISEEISWQRVIQQLCGTSHTISAKRHVPSQRRVTYDRNQLGKRELVPFHSLFVVLFIRRSLSSSSPLFFQQQRIAACDSTLFSSTIEFIYGLQFSLAKSLRFSFNSSSFLRQSGIDTSALNLRHPTWLLCYSVVWSHGYCQNLRSSELTVYAFKSCSRIGHTLGHLSLVTRKQFSAS